MRTMDEFEFEGFRDDIKDVEEEDLLRLSRIITFELNRRKDLEDDQGFHHMVYTCVG